MNIVQRFLKFAKTVEGCKSYKVEEHDTFGFVVTPDNNILCVSEDYFGGLRVALEYIPSKENGSGCSCNDDPIFEYDADMLKKLEVDGFTFAKSLGAKLYPNVDSWMKKDYWATSGLLKEV